MVYLNTDKIASANAQINIGMIMAFANNAQITVNLVIQMPLFAPNVKIIKF